MMHIVETLQHLKLLKFLIKNENSLKELTHQDGFLLDNLHDVDSGIFNIADSFRIVVEGLETFPLRDVGLLEVTENKLIKLKNTTTALFSRRF